MITVKNCNINIEYTEHTNHFFIVFVDDQNKVMANVLVSENVAIKTAEQLKIVITK